MLSINNRYKTVLTLELIFKLYSGDQLIPESKPLNSIIINNSFINNCNLVRELCKIQVVILNELKNFPLKKITVSKTILRQAQSYQL